MNKRFRILAAAAAAGIILSGCASQGSGPLPTAAVEENAAPCPSAGEAFVYGDEVWVPIVVIEHNGGYVHECRVISSRDGMVEVVSGYDFGVDHSETYEYRESECYRSEDDAHDALVALCEEVWGDG